MVIVICVCRILLLGKIGNSDGGRGFNSEEASQQSIIYVDRMLQIHFEVIAQFGSLI